MDPLQKNIDLILEEQKELERAISETTPMVSEELPVTCLIAEYDDNPIFTAKILSLAEKYKSLRRTRPDGNSFFRSFAYSYLKYLILNSTAFDEFRTLAEGLMEKLRFLEIPNSNLEPFYEKFLEVLDRICPDGDADIQGAKDELHYLINDQIYSTNIVVYLRLITSAKLQQDADFYKHFIVRDQCLCEFRHQHVEPMFKESDHIHIFALCTALNVAVRVEYLDRCEGGTVVSQDVPEGAQPMVYLVHRPSHYDILYPN